MREVDADFAGVALLERRIGHARQHRLGIERVRDGVAHLVDAHGLAEANVVEPEAPHVDGAGEHRADGREIERLQDVVERAHLHGVDGARHRALAGHHDADEIGIDLERGAEQRQAVHPRHHQVGEQHVEGLLAQGRQRLLRHREPGDVVAFGRQRAAEGFHLPRFVVDDEQAGAHPHES